jgi:hypothetical protein
MEISHEQVWQGLAVVGGIHLLILFWWLYKVATEKPKTQAELFKQASLPPHLLWWQQGVPCPPHPNLRHLLTFLLPFCDVPTAAATFESKRRRSKGAGILLTTFQHRHSMYTTFLRRATHTHAPLFDTINRVHRRTAPLALTFPHAHAHC